AQVVTCKTPAAVGYHVKESSLDAWHILSRSEARRAAHAETTSTALRRHGELNGSLIVTFCARPTLRHCNAATLQVKPCEEDGLPYEMYNFAVDAECAWGYEGTPVAQVCDGANKPYTLDARHKSYVLVMSDF
ncbi:unnamed protein product, partial [Effrenium voratum]